jgi:hypothetical protein
MALPSQLVRAYHRWRQINGPLRHLASGQRHAPTYDVENDLDHLHSSLCTQMDELMTAAQWSHRSSAGESLAVLAHIEQELNGVEASEDVKRPLLAYVAATRELLAELERLSTKPLAT